MIQIYTHTDFLLDIGALVLPIIHRKNAAKRQFGLRSSNFIGGRCGHRPLREAFSAPCPMSVPPQTAIQPADYVQPHNEHYVVTTATANAPADEGVALC